MASIQDIRDALAALVRSGTEQHERTMDAIRALEARTGANFANVGAVPGAAPPVLTPQSVLQTVQKPPETTVQLSLSDGQYTAAELDEAPALVRHIISPLPSFW